MDIVKKNWLSIVCGVVAILAIVADFYPMAGMRDKLSKEAKAHAAIAIDLNNLAKKPRTLPSVDLDSDSKGPLPLTSFPTQPIIDSARGATEQVNKAAVDLVDKASEITRHKPLVEDVLPGALGDSTKAQNFARAYIPWFDIAQGEQLAAIMHAARPPSDKEIGEGKAAKKIETEQTYTLKDSNGAVTNATEVQQYVADAQARVPDQMRRERAAGCRIYITPTSFVRDVSITVNNATDKDVFTKIFNAQLGLWCQQDVAEAIAKINDSSQNVMESPIKNWVKFTFSPVLTQPTFVFTGIFTSGNYNGPAAPPQPQELTGPLPKDASMSPTQRMSNGMFDVVQFDVELIVDSQRLPQVLAAMGDGRYLSVIQVLNLDPVDSALAKLAGFYYGDKPCVKVKVRCEDLFFRNWLSPMMPDNVKKALGVPIPPPAKV